MYTQFFGNYLFSKGYITKEQLLNALSRHSKEQIHVPILALYDGCMSSSEIEYITSLQAEEGKSFSELAISNGILSQSQILELINGEHPDFLILGQRFIDDGILSYYDFENILADYRSQNEFLEMELTDYNLEDIHRLLDEFSIVAEAAIPAFGKAFLELLFNNLVRYVGDDFSTLPPMLCTEFATDHCVCQTILGKYTVNTYLGMDEDTAIAFAERYANDSFTEYDEYVAASLEDFINLHNGLFIVNASNETSSELSISTIDHITDSFLEFDHLTYLFPIHYSFGIIHFIMEVVEI